jgi:hypothetical protein
MGEIVLPYSMHSVFPARRQEANDGPAKRGLGHHLSQAGWYALPMPEEIPAAGILKNYGQALCFLPESVRCNTVNPDRDTGLREKTGGSAELGCQSCGQLP